MSLNSSNSTDHSYLTKYNELPFYIRIILRFGRAIDIQSGTQIISRPSGSLLNYLFSPYASGCLLMAILLNRIVVFASARRTPNTENAVHANGVNWKRNLLRISIRVLMIYYISTSLMYLLAQYSYHNSFKAAFQNSAKLLPLDSFLWKVFTCICISQITETFLSVTAGQDPLSETGITLFEHSLAFQENITSKTPSPQLLFIVSIALLSQLNIHILKLTNLTKYQLIPSSVLGISMVGYYIYNAFNKSLLAFPKSILMITIIPQLSLTAILILCFAIYYLAVLFSGDASRLRYTTMMDNLSSSLNLQLNDDFNSTLMRFGTIVFNAIDKDEYVNELPPIIAPQATYLEKSYLSGYLTKFEAADEYSKPQPSESGRRSGSKVYKRLALCLSLVRSLMKLLVPERFKYAGKSSSKLGNTATSDSPNTLVEMDIELDDDEEYCSDSGSELDPLEYDSEVGEEDDFAVAAGGLAEARAFNRQVPNRGADNSLISELFNEHDILELINPTEPEQQSFISSLRTHLNSATRLTRSSYALCNQDGILSEIIRERRHQHHTHDEHGEGKHHTHDEHDEYGEGSVLSCVICQMQPREIIIWPCKCFAICETCRISLGVRGFKICVCCRSKVDGYSKVFVP